MSYGPRCFLLFKLQLTIPIRRIADPTKLAPDTHTAAKHRIYDQKIMVMHCCRNGYSEGI
jgi:hypothetical protein